MCLNSCQQTVPLSVTLLFNSLLVLMMVFSVENVKPRCMHCSLGHLAQYLKAFQLQQGNLKGSHGNKQT